MNPFFRLFWVIGILDLLPRTLVDAGACKPTKVILTRATSDGVVVNPDTGERGPYNPLSTVNGASLQGALKYVMTETLHRDKNQTKCGRKNDVKYIHFFELTVCNPDSALWWFNYRQGGYGNQPQYRDGIFGQYTTMDGGRCHTDLHCEYFHGNAKKNIPKLGPYVGFKNDSTDIRNPTDLAYWYSLPGECPLQTWADKSSECKKTHVSGRCPKGKIPDGATCTWDYTYKGYVDLDDLVGLTSIKHPETGRNFTNATEFCEAGFVEFKRDPDTYEFVEGLDFWKNPLDRKANRARVEKMLRFYHSIEGNEPLDIGALDEQNPKCYVSTPYCYDPVKKEEVCYRNDELLCVQCRTKCPNPSSITHDPFPFTLKAVELENKSPPSDSGASREVHSTSLFLAFVLSLVFI